MPLVMRSKNCPGKIIVAFFKFQRDRAVRYGCKKYLAINQLSATVSTTFQRGHQKNLSNDSQNLFDLCGADPSDYVTDSTTNMEGRKRNVFSSDQVEVSSQTKFALEVSSQTKFAFLQMLVPFAHIIFMTIFFPLGNQTL